MFANNHLTVMNLAFPDVCKLPTPVGPVPLPLPNIDLMPTHPPTVLHMFAGCSPGANLLTAGTVSSGDEAGVATGVISNTIVGRSQPLLGSFKTFFGVAPATRMTSMHLQNTMNAVGFSLVPGQVRLLLLS